MRVGIVGSREFPDLEMVREYVRALDKDDVVVSGGARGVDLAAEQAAKSAGMRVDIYVPDWRKYGKRAAFLRNRLIVENSDRVVAFWDGVSRGTLNSMDLARELGKPLHVYSWPRTLEAK